MPEYPWIVARSVKGRRDRLQDSYFYLKGFERKSQEFYAQASLGGEETPQNLEFPVAPDMTRFCAFALADGVGGYNRGDLAAVEATKKMALFYQPRQLWQELEFEIQRHTLPVRLPSLDFQANAQNMPKLLHGLFQRINLHLHFHEVADIRTTLVAGVLDGYRLWLGNVGDSRLYRIPRDSAGGFKALERLTVDDSHLDRKIYGGEFLPFAPCSYGVSPELQEHLEQEGRYAIEFVFDLTRLEPLPPFEASFEQRARLAHEEIAKILADGSGRLYRRAMQLGVVAPAFMVKDEGILSALGHREWLGEDAIRCSIRQGRRKTSMQEPLWLDLAEGDLLLLCSDGLTDVLSESRIQEMLGKRFLQPAASKQDLQSACDELVFAAQQDEACSDNVTAILVQLPMELRRTSFNAEATPPLDRPLIVKAQDLPKQDSERSNARWMQALQEKKATEQEFLAILKKLEKRLEEQDSKLEELRLSMSEFRSRLAGVIQWGRLLERLLWQPWLLGVAVVLMVLLLLLELRG